MNYLINHKTKEHIVLTDTTLWGRLDWTLVEADSEGWIKHAGTECPLPDDVPCLIRFKGGKETGRTAGIHWLWGLGTITHYKPIFEQAEPTPAPQYDPRSVSFNLLKRLQAAHEQAQQIPDLEAELRRELAGMGYTLGMMSPFVEPANSTAVVVEPEAVVETPQDMSDWRNWREGDLVECIDAEHGPELTVGDILQILGVYSNAELVRVKLSGFQSSLFDPARFRFHSRPAKGE